jgi:hypothetical protein
MKNGFLKIEKAVDKQSVPVNLLQLADPSPYKINEYLQSGTCYIAKIESEVIGVMVLNEVTPSSIEIKILRSVNRIKAEASVSSYCNLLKKRAGSQDTANLLSEPEIQV